MNVIEELLRRVDIIEHRLSDLELRIETIDEASTTSFSYVQDDICELRSLVNHTED